MQPHELQHTRLPCPSLSPGACSKSVEFESIESVMPSNHLILCCPFLLWLSIFLSIRFFYTESVLQIRWPKDWSFSFSISSCCCCSVTQSCPTLCDPTDCSAPGLPVPHHLLKFAQIHVHCIGDAIWPSDPLMPSSPALNLSWHEGLFQWVGSSHQVAKVLGFSASTSVLPMNTQDWSPLGWTG